MYLNHYGQLHVRTYDSNYVFQVRAPLDLTAQTWVFASTGIHGLKGREFNSVRALGRGDLTSYSLAANKHNGCSIYVLVDAASHGRCSFLQPTFRERLGASTLCQTLLALMGRRGRLPKWARYCSSRQAVRSLRHAPQKFPDIPSRSR